jgi:hypothetical protein
LDNERINKYREEENVNQTDKRKRENEGNSKRERAK